MHLVATAKTILKTTLPPLSEIRGILYVHIPFIYSGPFSITSREQLYMQSAWAIHIVTRRGEFWRYNRLEITARME